MADAMEIIISAVDSASEVFQSIIESATNMASGITDAVGSAGSDFDTISENAANFSDSVSNIDTSTLEELASELGMDTEEVERLISSAADIGSMSAGFNEVAGAADELEQEIQDDIDKMDELGSAGDVMAANTLMDFANGVSDKMSEMADKAGTVQDSWTRLGLAAEGAGINMDTMKSSVSSLADETGRAGGSIRESFISMTSAGITDMNTMQEVFRGASAQAFLLGTDVNSLADKFSGMAMKSTISEKTLKGTGVTMQELGEAMGMQGATVDEIKQKWGELDTNQRAAALGMAASMNEGQTANDAYKDSWQGLQDQIEIAKGKLERIVGSVILPVVVPAMKVAGDILSGVGDVIDFVMKTPLGGLISVLGTAAGVFIIVATAVASLTTFLGFLRVGTMLETTATIFNTAAKILNGEASGAGAIANALLGESFMASAAAAWTAAAGFIAAAWPLLAIVAAVALVVVAVYELGKAFGWWTDVSSMIDAIKSGIMRLWNAFINHPDVQAAISAISGAISVLWGWIQQAGQAIMEFFGISTGGDFDIVRALIDGIGNAWNMLKMALGPVIGAVQNIIQVFDLFRKGQIDLPQFIWSVLGILANMYVTIFTRIGSFVGNFALKLIRAGINMARNFVLGIINRLKQLPGKVFSALMMVVSRLLVAGSLWVTTVKQKALDVVNGAYNTLTSLPGKIASALSGVVDAITKPFKKGYEDAKAWWDKMTQLKMPNFQAGEPLDITGNNSLSISSSDNGPIIIEDNINLTVDLKNIPAGMSAESLITALQDKNVLNALVSNRDFQSLDAQVKQKINLKKMRSGGI